MSHKRNAPFHRRSNEYPRYAIRTEVSCGTGTVGQHFPCPVALSYRNLKSVTGCVAEASSEIELQALVASRHPLTDFLQHFHANLHGIAGFPADGLNGCHL